jgi:Tfp pilus assembly protein FimT
MKKGMTLVEAVVAMAIFLLVFYLASASFVQFYKKGGLENYLEQTTATLREAQARASAGESENDNLLYFGVLFEEDSFQQFATLSDYNNRVVSWDFSTDLDEKLSFSNISLPDSCVEANDCILFFPIEATTSASGSVTIENQSGESKTININTQGRINCE